MSRPGWLTSAVCAAAWATAAQAHHSFAMFDFSKTVTVNGVVKELQWTNPHVLIWIESEPAAGQPATEWTAELTSPGNLTRMGWTKRALKPGDRVEMQINPLRDGSHGGAFHQAKLLSTGQIFTSNLRSQPPPGAP